MAIASPEPRDGTFHGIQMLRAVAAIIVAAYHWAVAWIGEAPRSEIFENVTPLGSVGVDIFFVISGFVIYTATSRGDGAESSKTFFTRRFQRIYPLYWLLFSLIVLARMCGFSVQGLAGSYEPMTVVSLIQNILLFPTQGPFLGVAWTLHFEVYFYLVFGALIFVRPPLVRAAAVVAVIGGVFVLAWLTPENGLSFFFRESVVFEFLLGVLLAVAFEYTRGNRWPSAYWMTPFVAVLALSPWLVDYDWDVGLEPRLLWLGLPSAGIVAASLRLRFRPGMVLNAILLLGNASYAIYLVHTFFIVAFARLLRAVPLEDLPRASVAVAGLLISCLAGVALYLGFERPLRHLFRSGRLVFRAPWLPARVR